MVAVIASLLSASALAADLQVQYPTAAFSGRSSFTVAVPQFDPSLGTLTSVQIALTMQLTPIITLTTFGALPVDFTNAYNDTGATGFSPYGNPISHAPVTWSAYSQTGSADFSYGIASGVLTATYPTFTEFDGPAVSADSTTDVPAADFASFEGLGVFDQVYASDATFNIGATGSVFVGGDAQFDGAAVVTYTYSPAPEPATLALLTLGGLTLLRGRRRVPGHRA